MKLILRVLSYLAPSKGKIVLVVFVSLLTSLFSVVSIYSVLPLLNAIFTADKTVSAPVVPGPASVDSAAAAPSGGMSLSPKSLGQRAA